ncbi:transcriptional family [Leptolyngbya sp. Heron Island J]|uniref:helix-turn-helix transcriptional regulator n=1 Tax=Leptolyngbya sp. Heron Island J TaxID=1385935 RepID=UPI0003B9A237|nr:AraC family transcriptional regulator [Leptolyngbya sp. Heron Island J]ESA38731.1 transcriptional family [Leptolyngbya sp. Heron Island J]
MNMHLPNGVNFAKENENRRILQNQSLISSNYTEWNGVYCEYRKSVPGEVPQHFSQQHLIIINTEVDGETQYEQRLGDQVKYEQLREGDVIIVPANVENGARWYAEHCYILLSIDANLFQSSALRLMNSRESYLIPHFAKPDSFLYGIGLALKQELESMKEVNQLYIDTLIETMIAYLIKNYTTCSEYVRHCGNPSKIKVRKIIDYINDNLCEDISLAELAGLANVTPNYFSTMFKKTVGISPHQYILRCKISRAKQLLNNHDLSIARIAQDLGFSHHSHLTYHFKRLVGITPKYFRDNF